MQLIDFCSLRETVGLANGIVSVCSGVASSVFERWHIDGNIAKAGQGFPVDTTK